MAILLENVPAARLFDEMLKLLLSGHAVKCLTQLREEGLHHGLLPLLDVILEQPLGQRFVWLSLEKTDARVREDKPVSPGFLFATLLWHEVLAAWDKRKAAGEVPQNALFAAMDDVLDAQADKLAITRRIAGDIKDIWALQPRFAQRSGKRPLRVIEQPRFRAGYDFLRLRAESGEIEQEEADWWERFANADHDERQAMLVPEKGPARKRRRRRRKPADGSADTRRGRAAGRRRHRRPTEPAGRLHDADSGRRPIVAAADCVEHLHDLRVVCAPAQPQRQAVVARRAGELGHRPVRIPAAGAGQPHRLQRDVARRSSRSCRKSSRWRCSCRSPSCT